MSPIGSLDNVPAEFHSTTSLAPADDGGRRHKFVQKGQCRLARAGERVEVGLLMILQQQAHVDLAQVDLSHGPGPKLSLADFLIGEKPDIGVPFVFHDTVEELANLVASSLEHLDEDVAAETQEAGYPPCWVIVPRRLQNGVGELAHWRLRCPAGIEASDEHLRSILEVDKRQELAPKRGILEKRAAHDAVDHLG